jgi:lipoprotein-releasing system permease protein
MMGRLGLAWFLALQFLREHRGQTWLTVSAVAVGVSVMIFLSALITGLQQSLIEQTLGSQAHITIKPPEEKARPQLQADGIVRRVEAPQQRLLSISDWQNVAARLRKQPGVLSVAPGVSGNATALRGNAERSVVAMGFEPSQFESVIGVSARLVEGQFELGGAEVVVGERLARDLGMGLGDKLRLRTQTAGEMLFTIVGVFDLGSQQVNQRWVLLGQRSAQSLLGLPGGVNLMFIDVRETFEAEEIAQRMLASTGLVVDSWMKTNERLLVALRSQSSSSYTIQFFVFLAVAIGIASILVVSVVQRTREIGILRAMGTERSTVFWLFVVQGGLIGLVGSLFGAALGTGLALGFARVATAPDGSPTFPIALSSELYLLAVTLATLTGVLAAALPARRAARLDPVEAIRHA